MPIQFEQPQPMAPGISEGAGALSQYERDRQFAMQQREQQLREQQAAFSQQLQSAQFQQSQVQPFQLNEQRESLAAQGRVQDLTIHEQMRMQRIQQQISAVQEDMSPGGRLDPVVFPGVGANMLTQLRTGLDPLQAQMQASQRQHVEEQTRQIADTRARMASMDEQDRLFRARSLSERIIRRPNPFSTEDNPLPDLEYVEQPNGTFLPMNEAAVQAQGVAHMNQLQAQADHLGQDRAITPEVVGRAFERAHGIVAREIERLRTAAGAVTLVAGTPAHDNAQSALANAIANQRQSIQQIVNQEMSLMNQHAGGRPGGGVPGAGGGVVGGAVPGWTGPPFAPPPLPGQPPSQERQDYSEAVQAAYRAAFARLPAAGPQRTRLLTDLTALQNAMLSYGAGGDMPQQERERMRVILARLGAAGIPFNVLPVAQAGGVGGDV